MDSPCKAFCVNHLRLSGFQRSRRTYRQLKYDLSPNWREIATSSIRRNQSCLAPWRTFPSHEASNNTWARGMQSGFRWTKTVSWTGNYTLGSLPCDLRLELCQDTPSLHSRIGHQIDKLCKLPWDTLGWSKGQKTRIIATVGELLKFSDNKQLSSHLLTVKRLIFVYSKKISTRRDYEISKSQKVLARDANFLNLQTGSARAIVTAQQKILSYHERWRDNFEQKSQLTGVNFNECLTVTMITISR